VRQSSHDLASRFFGVAFQRLETPRLLILDDCDAIHIDASKARSTVESVLEKMKVIFKGLFYSYEGVSGIDAVRIPDD